MNSIIDYLNDFLRSPRITVRKCSLLLQKNLQQNDFIWIYVSLLFNKELGKFCAVWKSTSETFHQMNFKMKWVYLVAPCRSDSFRHAYVSPLCSALLSLWEDHIPTIHIVNLKVFSFLPKYALKADWENHLSKQKGFMTRKDLHTPVSLHSDLKSFYILPPRFCLDSHPMSPYPCTLMNIKHFNKRKSS